MKARGQYRPSINKAAEWRRIWLAVRKRQAAEKLTDIDLAAHTGVKFDTLQDWLARGGGRPTTEKMEAWAEDWM